MAFAMALLVHMAAPALANGVHVGSREVFAGEVGPYKLAVSTAPSTGLMHFIILLSTVEGDSPVPEARFTLQGELAADESGAVMIVGPVDGYATPEGPLWFAADLLVESAGLWDFTLTVDSPEGREQVMFAVPVVEASGGSLTLIALIVVALAMFGFVLGNRMFGRRSRRARGRRPQ
jgi:hypothetical protein